MGDRPGSTMGIQPAQTVPASNWSGNVVVTTANPHKLMNANRERKGWRIYALDPNASSGKLGYNNAPGQAYIPLPPDATYPVGNDSPCEANEIWFHGPAGSTLGVGEA